MTEGPSQGPIDQGQRRIAQRLALQALRRFHRENPLAAGLRTDALVARVRSLAERGGRGASSHRGAQPLTLDDAGVRHVIDDLVAAGGLVRAGRRVRLPEAEARLDPVMAERVEVLLAGLRATAANPPRVEGIAARLGIPPNVIAQLRVGGQLRQIAPGIDYPADVWAAIRGRVEDLRGPISVARLRDELRTSRRHAEAILAAVGARRPRSRTQR